MHTYMPHAIVGWMVTRPGRQELQDSRIGLRRGTRIDSVFVVGSCRLVSSGLNGSRVVRARSCSCSCTCTLGTYLLCFGDETLPHSSPLQPTATHCNPLQPTPTHSSTWLPRIYVPTHPPPPCRLVSILPCLRPTRTRNRRTRHRWLCACRLITGPSTSLTSHGRLSIASLHSSAAARHERATALLCSAASASVPDPPPNITITCMRCGPPGMPSTLMGCRNGHLATPTPIHPTRLPTLRLLRRPA